MAKIVESKLVIKGESASAEKSVKTITQAIERLASAAADAQEALDSLNVGGGGGGRRGAGRPTAQSQRSPYAPGPAAAGLRPGQMTQQQIGQQIFGGGFGQQNQQKTNYTNPETEARYRRDSGLRAGMGRLGSLVGGMTAVAGGIGGQMTPMVGGMMMGFGGALTGMAGGLGGIGGIPLMALGGMMNAAYMASQPGLQFGTQAAGWERRMGRTRSDALRAMFSEGTKGPAGAYKGIFGLGEAMQYGGQLAHIGAGAAMGTMAKMRGGGFEPELMMPFLQTVTQAGAAGARGAAQYDWLGKLITKAFKEGVDGSTMGQSIETMTGVMQVSEQYLSDISTDQATEMAAFVEMGKASGSAFLKGPRAVQAYAGITNAVATQHDPATEMLLWNVMSKQHPGMNYYEFQKKREDPVAALGFVRGLASMGAPKEMVAMIGKQMGLAPSLSKMETLMGAIGSESGYRKEIARLEKKKVDETGIDFTKEMNDLELSKVQMTKNSLENQKIEISLQSGMIEKYAQMEIALTDAAASLTGKMGPAIDLASKAFEAFANKLHEYSPEEKARIRKEYIDRLNEEYGYGVISNDLQKGRKHGDRE